MPMASASETTSVTTADAQARLLKAWRGEIIAGASYDLIANRMPEREATILRKMAEAESGHRKRLEQRMRELGIEIPDPSTVKVPLWLRLQIRVAPVDRLLAAREAAEDEEVDDLYKRPTGDLETDQLLRDIRKEERSHSMAVQDIRSGSPDERDRRRPCGHAWTPRSLPRASAPAWSGSCGRERWHTTGGGWLVRGDLRRQRRPGGRVRDRRRRFRRDRRLDARAHRRAWPARSRRRSRWPPAHSWPSAHSRRSPRPTSSASARRSPSTPRRRRRNSRSSTSSRGSTSAPPIELAERHVPAPGRDAQGALGRGVRRHRRGRRQRRSRQRWRPGSRPAWARIIPVIPFMITTGTVGDRRRGDRLARRPLPGRRRQVAGHPAHLVGGGARDDARRRDRRRRDVPRRPGAADVARRPRSRSRSAPSWPQRSSATSRPSSVRSATVAGDRPSAGGRRTGWRVRPTGDCGSARRLGSGPLARRASLARLAPEQLLEAILLLARAAGEPARVAALDERRRAPVRPRPATPACAIRSVRALISPGVCGPRSSRTPSTASSSRPSQSPSSARWRYLIARLPWPLASRASAVRDSRCAASRTVASS